MTGRVVRGPRSFPRQMNLKPALRQAKADMVREDALLASRRERPHFFAHEGLTFKLRRGRGPDGRRLYGFVSLPMGWLKGWGLHLPRPSADQMAAIARHLQANGIWVPRVQAIDSKRRFLVKHKLLLVANGNRSLAEWKKKFKSKPLEIKKFERSLVQNDREWQRRLYKVFRMMGRVHAAGVSHGHPHRENILVDKNRVGLCDLKHASFVPSDLWTRSGLIFHAFRSDYEFLFKVFNGTVPVSLLERGFDAMVRRYPCSEEVKRDVRGMIHAQWFRDADSHPSKERISI